MQNGIDGEDEAIAKAIPFEGSVDPKFVGKWKSPDRDSRYEFLKDGKYVADSIIQVKGRDPIKSHLEGQWKVSNDRMLFRDAAGTVVPYIYTLKGDELELSLTGKMKTKTRLRRVK